MTTLVQSAGSSIEKGESLLDTGYTLRAIGADAIVIRHPAAGAPLLMAKHLIFRSSMRVMACTSIPRRRCWTRLPS